MPPFLDDEVSKIDDIEALLITARGLSLRFHQGDMRDVADQISHAIKSLASAKAHRLTGS